MRKISALIFLIGLLILGNKLSAQPNLEWVKNYGGSEAEGANSIQQTTDGGYIVAGSSRSINGDVGGNNGISDYWIIKLDIAGNLEWEKNYGGSDSDTSVSIQQTTDGGYIVAGGSRSTDGDVGGNYGSSDCWIIKLDMAGNLEWEKNYGGSEADNAQSIQQTTDGGYIVAGYSRSTDGDVGGNNGSSDYWIIKLDIAGNLEWEKNYGGSDSDLPQSIQQTTDGGYIVVGYSRSINGDVGGNNGSTDYWIIKLDIAGNLEWEKNYGGSDSDTAFSIQQTTDGGYIVVGDSRSNNGDVGENYGSSDYWIIKLDIAGNLEWEKNYGGSDWDFAWSIQQTTDGGYIVAGDSRSTDGDVGGNYGSSDCWIIKLDMAGNLEWEKNYGGSGADVPQSIQQTTDGGYIVASESTSTDGDVGGNYGSWDSWIVKLDPIPVGIQTTNFSPKFTISPNPSKGEFTIHANDLTGPFTIKIFDALGHSIYTKNEIHGPLNIGNVAKGNYYIHITSDKFSFTRKLIVH
jgi:Secretion system C-terminal sorting domain